MSKRRGSAFARKARYERLVQEADDVWDRED